jgi:branched-chain amino acid transport system ATP-binding protein
MAAVRGRHRPPPDREPSAARPCLTFDRRQRTLASIHQREVHDVTLLEVHELSKAFGGLKAVDDASFSVADGSITSLIGPNGAGKTTAFNLISGTLEADSGSARFSGEELIGRRPHRIARLGMSRTFQITRELGDLSVLENVVMYAQGRGLRAALGGSVSGPERDRAMDLLAFVGIAYLAGERAKNLSYGQKKLMEFAATLMAQPRMILLDEPAGGVNPALLERIVARIRDVNRDGITFLVVEHNMDVVMDLSDSVVVMAHGQVLMQGTPAEVQADDAVLDAYLGNA